MILVKALPHLSSNYFETVCCAGIGHDLRWRRLYPVPFRILSEGQKFGRWHWLNYDYTPPASDARTESQKVVPESIKVGAKLKQGERSRIACALTRESVREAEAKGETLALIKPEALSFSWRAKDGAELSAERRKHAHLANQSSLLNSTVRPLNPCPYEFRFQWKTAAGATHNQICDDWETSTAFFRRRTSSGSDAAALESLRQTYEQDYFARGMRFTVGTHSRRAKQWLLVGVLRVDDSEQTELAL